MSRFIPINYHASRLLNHGPTVVITSFDEQSSGVTLWLQPGQCRWSLNRHAGDCGE